MFFRRELEYGFNALSFTPAFAPGRSGASASALLAATCSGYHSFVLPPRTYAGRVFVNSSG
jgi:hypothetical protein